MEGFTDFLSLLELRPHLKTNASFLVLNSLALVNRSLELLGRHRRVLLYLDQDAAGRKVTERLLQSNLNCRDHSSLYKYYKDLNELLVARQGKAKQLRLGPVHGKRATGKQL
ncbi:toprim domain-containing protein [Pontibacter burrus]|uniref:Toprim domain-containing protein n=1 Tax=Pontibacter burrus TaxID=2704466 RepID=A0A6B3M0S0_9BACT|nr:toprim domain-containing protein [Pontibacter burrus]